MPRLCQTYLNTFNPSQGLYVVYASLDRHGESWNVALVAMMLSHATGEAPTMDQTGEQKRQALSQSHTTSTRFEELLFPSVLPAAIQIR